MPELSKTARNERRKLIATYWNNIAVGMLITGYLAPALALCLSDDFRNFPIADVLTERMTPDKISKISVVSLIVFTSLAASIFIHRVARKIVSRLED